ncbi:DUF2141 domain-containing protein [Novosphingobium mangrovi (ex Huang et al. 2023)]|uniref:DUF2141 domain-containing protein n=1 Tax=Novosphingobium mangrovi (ex Huang et al. 2023) TaxID=2976432 RepID=A0ABT2I427_9SPHN|nr:DUF2141 domain-containing protein [Novosphingobium mangrovi (ex Huang et al. 2023)]MCT2399556.1 DUF2141 domain-containing protein [Novosphingobium mangrovi (ex Huang et al. 2023)]
MSTVTLAPFATAALPLLAAATIPSTPDLGKAEGQCRPGEKGPAFLVDVEGLKDRTGNLKLEVYPDNNKDFLEDDNILISAGKTFRRVEVPVPATGTPELCIRLPAPGTYAVSLLHDRNEDRKFNWTRDGIGFAGNPRLGWGKPKASKASAVAGNGLTRITIVLNYQHGLGVAPLHDRTK